MDWIESFFTLLRAEAAAYLAGLVVAVPKILLGLLVALFFWWLAGSLRNRFQMFTATRLWPHEVELLVSRTIYIAILLVGAVVVLGIWDQDVTALVAGLGVVGVAAGFALRNILENLIAGVLLLLQRPFSIGDQIKSGDYLGEVEVINLRATLLRTPDRRQLIIPNAELYTARLINLTRYPRRRSAVALAVDATGSISAIQRAVLEVIRRVDGVLAEPPPEVIVTGKDGESVMLEARFWTASNVGAVNQVTWRVVEAFAAVGEGAAETPPVLKISKVGTVS